MRIMREWRNLKLLKRAGRGHDPGGVEATPQGSCAVECPACPHPGKNLPVDWQEAPPERRFVLRFPSYDVLSSHLSRWLYTLFVGLDANFRLKRKKVSTDEADPGLNRGCAYFVEETKYKEHIKTFGTLTNGTGTGMCNNHDAVKLAEMKGTAGIAATGVGTVECTRHDMKRPLGVGDLQKGER